jgi:recombination protein RecA
MAGPDRVKSLDAVMAQIEKAHGTGAVMRLGDQVRVPIDVIPTGSIALDVALGIGGLPRGRVVEIYGPESSGKTTVALHAVANAQKAGGIAAFIDAEHALDPDYAQKLGVDTDALLVSQPDTGEQALEIADMLIRSGAIDIIVIDSVAALVPRAEIEGEMGDSHVGLQARLMSQALRKLTGTISSTNTTMIFINQLREKIGVMFGSPETTTGGKALKFYASVRLDVRRIETLKDGTDPVGNRTRVKVVKNKVAPPFKQAEFDIIYGFGISREGGLIDMGVEQGFVRKAGAWYTYDGDQLGQGKENARSFLKDNPDLADELEKRIKEKLGIGPRVDQLPEPVVAVPVKAVPAKRASSVKTVPIKGASAKTAPVKREPVKDLPIRATSGGDTSPGGAPVSSTALGGAPVGQPAVRDTSTSDAPVRPVPVDF